MVEAESIAAVVTGLLLAVLGGIGTLVVLVGSLAGALEWTALAWLLPLGFVVGAGILTWGAVELLSSVTDLGAEGLSDLPRRFDPSDLKRLLD